MPRPPRSTTGSVGQVALMESTRGLDCRGKEIGTSMGPRRCRRGRRRTRSRQGGNQVRFNGATPMSAWKTTTRPPAKRPCTSFNGATPMSAWKTGMSRPSRTPVLRLQWGHADVGVEDRDAADTHSAAVGFNGATPMSAWKTRPPPRSASRRRLQWGHADVGVEDREVSGSSPGTAQASMGPRRCRRGRRDEMPTTG